MKSVPVIFDTRSTYLCSPKKGDCMDIEENMFPINIKGIVKYPDIYRFLIV